MYYNIMNWYCYILRCTNESNKNLTYNGSTNNLKRRLNQHNGKISGGAKATKGKKWEYYCVLTGFETHSNALSCEWRIKKPTGEKRRPSQYCSVSGRINALNLILPLEYWTSKCTILNSDCKYTLYIVKNMVDNLDLCNIPDYIKVVIVDEINPEIFIDVF